MENKNPIWVDELDKAFSTTRENEQFKYLVRKANRDEFTSTELFKILKIIGKTKERECIPDFFMVFVADYAESLLKKDAKLGRVLLELALQRLTKGAIECEDKWTDEAHISYKYWGWCTTHDVEKPLSDACLWFIIKCLPLAATQSDPNVRWHVRNICFALTSAILPDGIIMEDNLSQAPAFENLAQTKAKYLYDMAEGLILSCASEGDIFRFWARPQIWQFHKSWFAQRARDNEWSWSLFFTRIGLERSSLKNWRTKKRIKEEITSLA